MVPRIWINAGVHLTPVWALPASHSVFHSGFICHVGLGASDMPCKMGCRAHPDRPVEALTAGRGRDGGPTAPASLLDSTSLLRHSGPGLLATAKAFGPLPHGPCKSPVKLLP